MINQNFFIDWMNQHPMLFTLLITWSMIWKGIALWKSAQNNHQKWFIALLILNTIGILEILYIYVFSKKKAAPEAK